MLWLAAHWPLFAVAGAVLVVVVFPAALQLLATRAGRMALAALLAIGALAYVWTARYADGYRAAQADAEKAALVAQGVARMKERHGEMRMAVVAERYERERRDGAQAAYDRALSDVRSGRVRLRQPWACPVSGAATASGERDAATRDREEAAARVVRIGAEADAQLAACQSVVREYLRLSGAEVVP